MEGLAESNQVPSSLSCAWIVDGMALLQKIKSVPETFGKFAEKVLHEVVHMAADHGAQRVDFATDRYPVISIKSSERKRRALTGVQQIFITKSEQKTPKQIHQRIPD